MRVEGHFRLPICLPPSSVLGLLCSVPRPPSSVFRPSVLGPLIPQPTDVPPALRSHPPKACCRSGISARRGRPTKLRLATVAAKSAKSHPGASGTIARRSVQRLERGIGSLGEDGGRRTEDGGRWTEDGGRRTEDGGRRSMVRAPLLWFSHHLAKLTADILALGEHRVLLRFRDVSAGKRGRNPMLGLRLFPIGI